MTTPAHTIRLQPLTALLEGAQIFQRSFLHCLPLALLFAAAQAVALAGFTIASTNWLGWILYAAAAIASGASAAGIIVLQTALFRARAQGVPVAPMAALRSGLAATPSWLATSLIGGLAAVCVITLMREGGGVAAIVAAVIAVPALIFAVSTQLAIPGVAAQRLGNYAALVHSHRLVWGNWWRTLFVMLLLFVVVLVALMVALVVLGIILGLVIGVPSDPAALVNPLRALVFLLVAVFVLPLWNAVTLAIYRQLSEAQPGADVTPSRPAAPPDTPAGEAR